MKSKSEEPQEYLLNIRIRSDQIDISIYVVIISIIIYYYYNYYHYNYCLQRDTILSKPADVEDDKSSILSDKTKPIQYNRSVEDDKSSYMSDKTKYIQYKRSVMGGDDDDATTADVTDVTTMQV